MKHKLIQLDPFQWRWITWQEWMKLNRSEYKPNKETLVFSLVNGIDNIGYLIGWQLSHFIFIEHFEIFQEFRGKNYGSEI